MYNQITDNKKRTVWLMMIFAVVIIFLGWVLNKIYGAGGNGILVISIVVATTMNLVGYYAGDKMAVASAGAVQIQAKDNLYLWRLIENLCITAGLPMPKVYIIPDTAINAFAAGRDPQHALIAVTEGAINKLNNEELEGVLAHELSHVKNYDIRVMTIVIICVGIVAFMADALLRGQMFRRRSSDENSNSGIFLIVGLLLALLAPLFANLIQLAVSRKREYLADASGALLTRFPDGLANALEKIKHEAVPLHNNNRAIAHLYISDPSAKFSKKISGLFSTHPPIDDRIAKLRAMTLG
jgi:heat shock protein HtpX